VFRWVVEVSLEVMREANESVMGSSDVLARGPTRRSTVGLTHRLIAVLYTSYASLLFYADNMRVVRLPSRLLLAAIVQWSGFDTEFHVPLACLLDLSGADGRVIRGRIWPSARFQVTFDIVTPRAVCHPAQCNRDQGRAYLFERKLEGRLPSFVVTKPNLLTKQQMSSLPLAPVSGIYLVTEER